MNDDEGKKAVIAVLEEVAARKTLNVFSIEKLGLVVGCRRLGEPPARAREINIWALSPGLPWLASVQGDTIEDAIEPFMAAMTLLCGKRKDEAQT